MGGDPGPSLYDASIEKFFSLPFFIFWVGGGSRAKGTVAVVTVLTHVFFDFVLGTLV